MLDCFARDRRELMRPTLTRDERRAWIGASSGSPAGLIYQRGMTRAVALHAIADGKPWLAALAETGGFHIERSHGFRPADPLAVGRARVVGPLMRGAQTHAAGWGKART